MLMASMSTLLAPMFSRLRNQPTKIDSDGELLRAFARTGSEAAFEELVRRHGSLVLGVCQRMLNHRHDAEDAFQATWIVLAKKARTIHRPEQLAHWLYGVARHAALNVRKIRKRRSVRELAWGESTDVADQRLYFLERDSSAARR
ncbi:MAG: sigma-70 family RNA polymerase sigma factor [Gemmatales bacterium]